MSLEYPTTKTVWWKERVDIGEDDYCHDSQC